MPAPRHSVEEGSSSRAAMKVLDGGDEDDNMVTEAIDVIGFGECPLLLFNSVVLSSYKFDICLFKEGTIISCSSSVGSDGCQTMPHYR